MKRVRKTFQMRIYGLFVCFKFVVFKNETATKKII